jgi:hypothetical protein
MTFQSRAEGTGAPVSCVGRYVKRPTLIAMVLFLALGAWSCARGNSGVGGDGASGIQGVVLAGPQCPVAVAGSPCPDRPFPGTVLVKGTGGVSDQVKTDDQGKFRLALAPGNYVVTLLLSTTGPPTAKPVSVTVIQGKFTQVTVEVDTSIR